MDATVMLGVTEIGKLLLQGYFSYMAQIDATAEETQILFESTRESFLKNSPDLLPDIELGDNPK